MTKLLISAWMLMVGFAVQAQSYTEMIGKTFDSTKAAHFGTDLSKMNKHEYGHMTVYTPKQEFKAPKQAGSGEVTLTFNLVYDPAVFMPPYEGVKVVNESYNRNFTWMGDDNITVTIPPGTYDFIVYFQTMETGARYYVIREQVEVTEDASFKINAQEATNHISIINYGPDGNIFQHGMVRMDEQTGEWLFIEEGNVDFTYIGANVYLKGVGLVGQNQMYVSGWWPEGLRTVPFGEYYVNDVSDRYVFTQSRIGQGNGTETSLKEWYLSYFSADNVKAGALENNPEDYVLCQENYQYSPHGQSQDIGSGCGMRIYHLMNGYYDGFESLDVQDLIQRKPETFSIDVFNSMPSEDPCYDGLNLLVGTRFEDNYITTETPWGEETLECSGQTFCTPYTIENGNQVFKNIGHFNSGGMPIGKTGIIIGDYLRDLLLPAPEAFTYPTDERLGIIGDNCPINAVKVISYFYQYRAMVFESNYVGRYGETRRCDGDETTFTFKFNGEEIEDPIHWSPEDKGIWEFTVTNTNIVVDGLQGENKTVVYYDETNEESTCPGIEMLHFRSEDGITDRFATAADGVMEFMGGDFKFNYHPEFWDGVYECQPMDVTVEYSPYGEENWRTLAVEEVPELFKMPGWGYFYRASLADVTGKATQGWFDVRFKLQDEVGNWQEQVVSPAFRIDDLVSTGVEEVEAAGDAREVARYSVDGRQLSAPQPGLNIVRMSDGTSRKVWVK